MKHLFLILMLTLLGSAVQAQRHEDPSRGRRGGARIHCSSEGYKYRECYTGVRYPQNIRLLEQYSNSPCIYGRTFGMYRNGKMWVNNSCEGLFRIR